MLNLNSRVKGFTLLEILIALFIFTIIAVIMTHALHIIFSSQEGTEKRALRLAELQIANLLLSRDIEQAMNRPIINGKNHHESAFQGALDKVSLTHGGESNPGSMALRSTLQRDNYFIEKNSLVREVFPVLDQVQASQSQRRVLLSGILEGHFDYLDSKGIFHNTWPPADETKATALPAAVRITLKLAGWGDFSQLYIIPAITDTSAHA
jgi:general secretion pathway protein J